MCVGEMPAEERGARHEPALLAGERRVHCGACRFIPSAATATATCTSLPSVAIAVRRRDPFLRELEAVSREYLFPASGPLKPAGACPKPRADASGRGLV